VSARRRTCLITGTTHGIGLETTRALAQADCQILMGCRDLKRAELVKDHLISTTGNPDIHVLPLDLASQQSIRDGAARVLEATDALHLLINNAGMMSPKPRLSADGIELTFATNHLGPFLLSELLLDRLRASAPARIVNVASAVHRRGTADFENPGGRYSAMRAYARSKLANVAYTLELAERLRSSGVTANCLHPGVVATNIFQSSNGLLRRGAELAKRFMLTPERGAATTIYLALSPEVEGVTGRYLDEHQRMAEPAPAASDPQVQAALRTLSARLTGLAA
jgi:NAD(P)-dependent dehydrogenase (short-subunit alcohol dehydrogenase family)